MLVLLDNIRFRLSIIAMARFEQMLEPGPPQAAPEEPDAPALFSPEAMLSIP